MIGPRGSHRRSVATTLARDLMGFSAQMRSAGHSKRICGSGNKRPGVFLPNGPTDSSAPIAEKSGGCTKSLKGVQTGVQNVPT
jgi:hypothetical protein